MFIRSAAAGLAVLVLSIDPSFAQFISSSSVPPDAVSVVLSNDVNPILDTLATLLGSGFAASVIALLWKFAPTWLQPLGDAAVKALMAHWLEFGIQWAIQDVEGFDKGKPVTFEVGSKGIASALQAILDTAPVWLLKLAGGAPTIVKQLVAWAAKYDIVLDTDTNPAQVASAALKSTT